MSSDQSPDFFEFVDLQDKAALKAFADKVVVSRRDFAGLIMASDGDAIPLGHIPIHRHFHPPELALTDANLDALSSNGVGPFSPAARKAANKLMAMLQQRRLFNAHFFWLLDHPDHWHLFYFDQRDVRGQHWVGGPHLHLMNHLTHPQVDARQLLDQLRQSQRAPRLSGLHLRCDWS